MKQQTLSLLLTMGLLTFPIPDAHALRASPLLMKHGLEGLGTAIAEAAEVDISTITPQKAYDTMIAMQKDFPEGMYWTDASSGTYTWHGGTGANGEIARKGTGCVNFAFQLSDAVFGNLPARMRGAGTFKFEDIKVGDILRVNNNRHSVIVLQINEDSVVIAEGNYNKSIHWGRILTKDEVLNANHVLTRYPENYVLPDDPTANEPIGEGDFGSGLHWKLINSGTLTVSGKGAMPDFSDFSDRPWNDNIEKINKIVVEDGITNIGTHAFRGSKAYNVSIASSVKIINNDAFRECANITSVTIPEGVITVGERVFQGCSNLKNVTFPSSIENVGAGTFYNCQELRSVKFFPSDKNVTIGDNIFTGSWYLSDLTLPTKIDSIGDGMFQSCMSLFYLTIPQGVQSIGANAFTNCSSLSYVIIPNSITKIGIAAFANCALTDIYFCGSKAEWDKIQKIGDTTATLQSKTIHYLSDIESIKVLNTNKENIANTNISMTTESTNTFEIEVVSDSSEKVITTKNIEWFSVSPNTPADKITDIENAENSAIDIAEVTQNNDGTLTVTAVKEGKAKIVGYVKKNPASTAGTDKEHIFVSFDINVESTTPAKIEVECKDSVTLTKNTLTYGEKLSSLSFAKAEFVEKGTTTSVTGTLAFKNPDMIPEIGTTSVEWIFTPTNTNKYNTISGSVDIIVKGDPSYADATLESQFKGSNDWYHGKVDIIPPEGHLISRDKKTWEAKLTISEDRTGNFSYYLKKEKTGEISNEKQIKVNIDTVAPTGSIHIGNKVWNNFLGSISSSYTKEVEFTIKAEDTASGMENGKIEYLIAEEAYEGEEGLKKLEQLPQSAWTVYSSEAKMKQNAANLIYVRLTDQAGNITYLSTDKIWNDSIKPEIVLSAQGTKYNDSAGNNAYDGSVTYTVNVQGEDAPLTSFCYSLDGEPSINLKDGDKITIDTQGIHVLKITAEDHVGNQSEKIETVHIYTNFTFKLNGTSSIYDGQPIELGTDFSAEASISNPEISFSYSMAGSEEKIQGLPTNAGNYIIYAKIAEDTINCYKPQSATMEYTIEPKEITPSNETLFITKNLATDYKLDLSTMIGDVTGDTRYNIISVSGSSILADTPKLEGSTLTIPVKAVTSEEQATIEISFNNPNYIIGNAVLTLAPTEKEIVQLTGITMPETGVYNGEKFAYTGTPVWTTKNGEKVEVSAMTVLYESTDNANYSSSEAPSNVGSYKVTISINNTDPNYIGTASTTFNITKKTVNVKVNDKDIFVGDSVPSLTELEKDKDYSIEGLVAKDLDSSIGTLSFTYTDENGKEVIPNNTVAGTYFISASGLENPNYKFEYVSGKLTIKAKPNNGDNNNSNNGGNSGGSSGGNNSGGSSSGTIGSGNNSTPTTNSSTNTTVNTTTPSDTNTTPPSDTKKDNIETKPDGTTVTTKEQTTSDGTQIKTITETAPDGTVLKESVTETTPDGSATTVTKETTTNSLGTTVSKVTVENMTGDNTITQTTEESSFSSDDAKTVVTTVKDGNGNLTEASAYVNKKVENTATGKAKLTISSSLTSQIAEAAGTDDVDIVISVTDDADKPLYSLTVNKKKLQSENSLYLYGYDAKTDTYTMVNAVEYKMSENGVTIKANAGGNYTLLTKTEMNRVSKQIMKTVKLSSSQKVKKSGKSFKVTLSKKANKASIKKIVYTTSNKKIATITQKGQVKTKTKGSVKVKAKVTMKNGKTKTLIMKVKVKN